MINKLSVEEIKIHKNEFQKDKQSSLVVIAEDIRSAYNVGSIFRTSDGVGLDKLYLSGYTPIPPREDITKTSLGSTESIPWEHYWDSREIIAKLKKEGYQIVVLEHTTESISYQEFRPAKKLCLIVGNEVFGVAEETVNVADYAVEIPMYGTKESLNVSVAYGIVIYDFLSKV